MKSTLRKQLDQYLKEGNYPLHMPGHKRRLMPEEDLPYDWDLTEVSETDDLHHAEGILKQAMDRTAELCQADRTWYLVNGSTVGNLAGVYALTHQNGEVIMARNCHRSLFHAAQLRNLHVHWLMPETEQAFQIASDIKPADVKKALDQYPDCEAVILTSPTYEGVVSDISSIAKICHQHNVPLFVDEAHGAHFGLYGEYFPSSAIENGADLVVQSFHKTLPSLTQTAVLHMRRGLVDEKKVEQALDIFETSSPSYPLMVSLDACTEYLLKEGKQSFQRWQDTIIAFEQNIQPLKNMKVLCHQSDSPKSHAFFAFDSGKLLIHSTITGKVLQDILLKKYHFECEMSMGNNVLAMTGPSDDPEEIVRFGRALIEIDAKIIPSDHDEEKRLPAFNNETCLTIADALNAEEETIFLPSAVDRISHEYVYCYPPGIPLLIPGERITENLLDTLQYLKTKGYTLHFSQSEDDSQIIRICK